MLLAMDKLYIKNSKSKVLAAWTKGVALFAGFLISSPAAESQIFG
jgi:hypothetical protein